MKFRFCRAILFFSECVQQITVTFFLQQAEIKYCTKHCQVHIWTSSNHRLETAGLNALEELLRCWEWTEKLVIPAGVS